MGTSRDLVPKRPKIAVNRSLSAPSRRSEDRHVLPANSRLLANRRRLLRSKRSQVRILPGALWETLLRRGFLRPRRWVHVARSRSNLQAASAICGPVIRNRRGAAINATRRSAVRLATRSGAEERSGNASSPSADSAPPTWDTSAANPRAHRGLRHSASFGTERGVACSCIPGVRDVDGLAEEAAGWVRARGDPLL